MKELCYRTAIALPIACTTLIAAMDSRAAVRAQTPQVMYGNYVSLPVPTPEANPSDLLREQGNRIKSTVDNPDPIKLPPLQPAAEPIFWETQPVGQSSEPLEPLPVPVLPESESLPPLTPPDSEPAAQQAPAREQREPSQSYFGIGGTIGLGGDETALGDGGFSLVSKAAFTENLSLHNATSFGKQTASMFALTGEMPIRDTETQRVVLIPFLGGGTLVTTDDELKLHGLIVGGVDVPISDQLMGTVRVNTGFVDGDTEVGLVLGVGYRFSVLKLFRR
ncbi:hypothetical protein [Roseofilum casamattae]|uniref:Outer membrane protein beta-barrel domain-containing protein n=1 Tax=Roseofilum casamattae BLCC-M143 TaxID=3022442 RepID=A0ABT7BWW7_9CYAN|nr:hypothetical protein [Roseofilum casamattae]MDJ1182768.1 hypothetical protein [Roseofilum casamattae BLCC-M143]